MLRRESTTGEITLGRRHAEEKERAGLVIEGALNIITP
jgi:hypothetical protein